MSTTDKVEYELAMCSPQTGGFGFVIRWERWVDHCTDTYSIRGTCFRCIAGNDLDSEGRMLGPYEFESVEIADNRAGVELNEFDGQSPVLAFSFKWDGTTCVNMPHFIHLTEPDYLIQLAELIKYVTLKGVAMLDSSFTKCSSDGLTFAPSIPYKPGN